MILHVKATLTKNKRKFLTENIHINSFFTILD